MSDGQRRRDQALKRLRHMNRGVALTSLVGLLVAIELAHSSTAATRRAAALTRGATATAVKRGAHRSVTPVHHRARATSAATTTSAAPTTTSSAPTATSSAPTETSAAGTTTSSATSTTSTQTSQPVQSYTPTPVVSSGAS